MDSVNRTDKARSDSGLHALARQCHGCHQAESVAIRLYHQVSGCVNRGHTISLVSLWRFHYEAQEEI